MTRLECESGRGRGMDGDAGAALQRLQRMATFVDSTEPSAVAGGGEVERHRVVVAAPAMSPHQTNQSYCCWHAGPVEASLAGRCLSGLEVVAHGLSAGCYFVCTGDVGVDGSAHRLQYSARDAGFLPAPVVGRRIAPPLPAVSASACVAGDTEVHRLELTRRSLRILKGTDTDQRHPSGVNVGGSRAACFSANPPEREILAWNLLPKMGLDRAAADTETVVASLHLCSRASACWTDQQRLLGRNGW